MNLQEESIILHKEYQGKLATHIKVPLNDKHDLSVAYTPGVAAPCLEIQKNEDLSFDLTCRGNMIAVLTDGTRVLGLGDIGPAAAIPVMEGKAILFKKFADIDAVPVCLDTKDAEEFIKTAKFLEKNFAGINLEDISSPKCYDIEDRLKEEMNIPVFHDDQHGTAIAALSALIGALKLADKKIENCKIIVNGAGAAGTAIARLIIKAGCKNLISVDRFGAIYNGMNNLNRVQQLLAKESNPFMIKGDLASAVKKADVLIGVSVAGAFTADIIRSMAEKPIVLALANPEPECYYNDAKSAGALVAGTGRSDTPNQVNNVMVFPGIFRGAIDVRASKINDEMKIAAANAISNLVNDNELKDDYVIPDPFDKRIVPEVASAVAREAIKTGVARIKIDPVIIKENTIKRLNK